VRRVVPTATVTEVVARAGGQLSTVYEVCCAESAETLIVKMYADKWRWKLAKEVHAYRLLARYDAGPCPKILFAESTGEHAFAVMTLLPGEPLSAISTQLDDAEIHGIYRQLGTMLSVLSRRRSRPAKESRSQVMRSVECAWTPSSTSARSMITEVPSRIRTSGSSPSRIRVPAQPRVLQRVIWPEYRVGCRAFTVQPRAVDGSHLAEFRLQFAHRPTPLNALYGGCVARSHLWSCAAEHRACTGEIGQSVDHSRVRAQRRGHHIGPGPGEPAVEKPGGQQPRGHRDPGCASRPHSPHQGSYRRGSGGDEPDPNPAAELTGQLHRRGPHISYRTLVGRARRRQHDRVTRTPTGGTQPVGRRAHQ